MKRLAVLPLALVLALLMVIPASAAPPVINSGTFAYDSEQFHGLCPGIEIRQWEEGTWREIAYYDNQGKLVRVQTHYAGTDDYYNPANGVVLSGTFNATLEWDASTGEMTGRGASPKVIIPGFGPVLMLAGRYQNYPDGPIIGQNTTVDPKATAMLCSLFAGN